MKFKRQLLSLTKDDVVKYLNITKNTYRPLDPGWYLYRLLLKFKNDKFSNEFIELIYVTLSAWNMNSRGAKLSDYDLFSKSINNYSDHIKSLFNYKISELSEDQYKEVINTLKTLFYSLILVHKDKPILVTFSKTMHFMMPNLVGPIDRKYTLRYFFNTTNFNKDVDKQYKIFCQIYRQYYEFSKYKYLNNYIDDNWNGNIPKIIDNIIIGYGKHHKY